MKRFLDPKSDLCFKRIFGTRKNITIDMLNALLPLPKGTEIVSIEYLSNEQPPRAALFKYSIVDVRCIDSLGRQFIVEMQVVWTGHFKERFLFNTAKAYVNQLPSGEGYSQLRSVYGLALLDAIMPDSGPEYYHHYHLREDPPQSDKMNGIECVIIELPKVKARELDPKDPKSKWLVFFNELHDRVETIPEIVSNDSVTAEALTVLEETSFNRAELEEYDKFWDSVSTYRTMIDDSFNEGLDEGRMVGRREGQEEGRREGQEEGRRLATLEIARTLLAEGMPVVRVSELTGMPVDVLGAMDSP